MKPVIIDMRDMSDSTEVYKSRPNRFLVYTIYISLLLVLVAFLWMFCSKVDIVVKSDGLFRGNDSIYEVSSAVTGKITDTNVCNGQYVEEDDVLYTLAIDSLGDTIQYYQSELDNADERLIILKAYEQSLDGDKSELESQKSNVYYNEFVNKRELLFTNIDSSQQNTDGQISTYQGNVDVISASIQKYEEKKDKLNRTKNAVISRKNEFGAEDSYYSSIINSYVANYNYTEAQYDAQIAEYKKQVKKYKKNLNQSVSGNDVSSKELQQQKNEIETKIETLKNEKGQALSNLELQQVASLEQQIESLNDTILSLQSNLTSAKLQLESVNSTDSASIEEIQLLTEKGNIAKEILSYQNKKDECENYLKSYDIQNNNCIIKANASGFYYLQQEIKQGTYVQEGASIGKIYPEKESQYYAEICVGNADIAKLHAGQEVNFEIAAYPSDEYGYFTGEVTDISKDITVNPNTGEAYYLVKAVCDDIVVKNKDGETATLMNGMACRAKVIVDEENMLRYILQRIDLID